MIYSGTRQAKLDTGHRVNPIRHPVILQADIAERAVPVQVDVCRMVLHLAVKMPSILNSQWVSRNYIV